MPPGPSESTIVDVAGAVVPASPADTPATAVPWNENWRSTASLPCGPEYGPGNAFATITFGVVRLVWPLGKPAGLRNGFVLSTPSSTIPIFTPSPRAPVSDASCGAPISDVLWFSERV